MAKFADYEVNSEVPDIMEKIVSTIPKVFEGFDVNGIQTVMTKGKKSNKVGRLIGIKYPYDIMVDKQYIMEVFDDNWKLLDAEQKANAVFHTMLSIPEGGFDKESDSYAKVRKPDYEVFEEELALGMPVWSKAPKSVYDLAEDAKKVGKEVESKRPVKRETIIAAAKAALTVKPSKKSKKTP